jgi:hypothetical protein
MFITHFCLHNNKRGRKGGRAARGGRRGGGFTGLGGGGSLHHKTRPQIFTNAMLATFTIVGNKKN